MDLTELDKAAIRMHPNTQAKLRAWGSQDGRYMEVQAKSALRRLEFVEPMGGGVVQITPRGRYASTFLLDRALMRKPALTGG